ncbi:MAG TPA: methyltransferase domain-containing protein [Gemmatimonadaceae bacterium]|nr:methyltransferase domain-containing protein [Gemmatimonadaceae bacterium]
MKVGHEIETKRAGWSFDGNVSETFVEHVRQSVPLYDAGHDLIRSISDYFIRDDSTCYEIGTSTGELIRKLATHHVHKPGVRWIGIDPVEAMIDRAREHCAGVPNIELVCDDAVTYNFEKADLFVSYYCVQFVQPRHRQELINKIYERLHWGGAFLLFEKVRGPDARFQDMSVALYNDFKAKNGFSADEILNKTASLKGVLEPFSTEGNLGLLRRAGFTDIMSVMKWICFEGFLAIK